MVAIYRLIMAAASLFTASAMPTNPLVAMQKRQSAGGSCSSPQFAPITSVGGAGTSTASFCESSWGTTYLPVTGIAMWSNNDDVTGIQLTYADGTQSPVLGGKAAVKSTSIAVAYGSNNIFSAVRLYNHATNAYVLHTLISNTKGDTINNGENVASDPDVVRHDQDVGSGILFGVTGTTHSNGNLASLGFLFLASPIANIGVSNVTFPNGPLGGSDGINPTTIGTAQFSNTASESVTYQFNNQISETDMWAFAQAYTDTFTVQEAIGFSFGFSLLGVTAMATSTTMFIWTSTTMETTTTTVSQTTQVQYNAAITLGPGQSASCTAVAGQGAGRFPYDSVVTVTLKNGYVFSFPQDGELTVNAFSQGEVSCTNGQVTNNN